jgi:TonB family protein
MFDLLDHSTQTQRVSCLSVSLLLHATLVVLILLSTVSGRYRFAFLPVVHAGSTEAVTRTVRTPLFLPVSGRPDISAVKPVVSPVVAETSDETVASSAPIPLPAETALLAVPSGLVIPENDAPVSFTYTPREIPSIPKPQPAIEAMPAPPREEPPPAEPLRIGGRVEQPKQIYRAEPIYPAAAKSARVQGVVEIEGVINEEGRIEQIKVVNGHPLLNDAAVECVRKWKYEPGRLNGQIIEMPIKILVRFQLRMQ